MLSRRFVLLLGVLVALNVTLWFAAPGFALRRAIVTQLFGPNMVRAQVHLKSGQDWNLDRGVITQVNGAQLTLREYDGRVTTIPLAATTKVMHRGVRLPLSALGRRWRVVVLWPPIGPAQSVDVERIPRTRSNTGF
ncbi:MAG TPA: hypothetical protein VFU33_06815 [Gaiellaceae bacterium]|nr:hypothetical protein [Gaiellaceae bacterium]